MREAAVIGPFRRLRPSGKALEDIQPGDFVRQVTFRGVGVVESVDGAYAVVAWDRDRRDILPLVVLRKTDAGGHDLDRRRK